MATNTPGSVARQDPRQVSNTIRASVTFATPGLTTGVQIGVLPQGAYLTHASWDISVGFTAATTFGVGTDTPTDGNIITAGTVNTGVIVNQSAIGKLGRIHAAAGDVPIFLKMNQAAIVGAMDIVIEYEGGFPG